MNDIPFHLHNFSRTEKKAALSVLNSSWVNTGSEEKKFTEEIKNYCRVSHCQLLNSATAGLFLTLSTFGIGKGDEVVTTPYTFSATAASILQTGAKPIFIDINKDFNINFNLLKKVINSKTKAIICVDFGGRLCQYEKAYEILKNFNHLFKANNLFQSIWGRPLIIADASHSFGSFELHNNNTSEISFKYQKNSKNRHICGELADISVFSFHTVKNLTTIDGGAIVSKKWEKSDDFFKIIRQKTLHGFDRSSYERSGFYHYEYDINQLGYKYNLTDLNATLGRAQLKRFPNIQRKKNKIVAIYIELLKKRKIMMEDSLLFFNQLGTAFHLFPFLIPIKNYDSFEKTIQIKNKVIQLMYNKNIRCNVHYKPLPLMTLYKDLGYKISQFPQSLNHYSREISLPLYAQLTQRQLRYIVNSLDASIKEAFCII